MGAKMEEYFALGAKKWTHTGEKSEKTSQKPEAEEGGGLHYEKEEDVLGVQLGKCIDGVLQQTIGYAVGGRQNQDLYLGS